jgi:hypothetical protein
VPSGFYSPLLTCTVDLRDCNQVNGLKAVFGILAWRRCALHGVVAKSGTDSACTDALFFRVLLLIYRPSSTMKRACANAAEMF